MAPTKSIVWNFMTKLSKTEIQCNLCKHKFTNYSSSTTTNLLYHVKTRHQLAYDLEKNKNKQPGRCNSEAVAEMKGEAHDGNEDNAMATAKASSPAPANKPSTSSQPTLVGTLQRTEKYKPNSLRKKMLDDLVLNLVTQDLQPLSVVDDPGFRKLLNALDPKYTIVSRKHLTNTMLPAKYHDEKAKLQAELNKCDLAAITTDQWTSRANDGYTTFTAHYIADDWKMKSAVLSTRCERKRHTAVNLSGEMVKCLEEFNLIEKISAIVTDNAANITNAAGSVVADDALGVQYHLGCFAHTLNLVVRHSLNNDPESHAVIKKVKDIVTFFNQSTVATNALREIQGEKFRKLKQDVDTRWNSTYLMLDSYLNPLDPKVAKSDEGQRHIDITTVLCQRGKQQLCLTEEELTSLKDTVKLLKIYYDATTEMSGESYTTVSKVIPLVRQLTRLTRLDHSSLARRLNEYLDNYFDKLESEEVLTMSTILDPRYKSKCFTEKNVSTIESLLKEKMSGIVLPEPDLSERDESAKKVKKNDPEETLSLWADFDEEIEKDRTAPSSKSEVDIEFDHYMELHRIARLEDPLVWWKAHAQGLPRLAKLAKRFLSIPSTSVPSERVFSKAGELIAARRANLKPKNVDMILFLNRRC